MVLIQLLCSLCLAANIAGETFPDSVQLNDQRLEINGVGLREKYWIDIYAAGLYLPQKTTSAQEIINQNVAKRIHAKFIYPSVPKSKMVEALEENIRINPTLSPKAVQDIRNASRWMEDFGAGDEMIFDYIPGKGTTVIIKGKTKGTIEGLDFMKAVFSMYVGPNPASEQLKRGLLGKE